MPSRTTLIRRRYIKQLKVTGVLVCGICGYGIASEPEITVDHILAKANDGKNHLDNLQPAHLICNQKKAATQSSEWLNHGKESNESNENNNRKPFNGFAYTNDTHRVDSTERKSTAKGTYTAHRSFEFRRAARKRRDSRLTASDERA